MSDIYVFSGPCGCGKSTLADAFAAHLVEDGGKTQVYVIHGDDFHRGFRESDRRGHPSFLQWTDILAFNWECMLNTASSALRRGLDVVIDYVVEDELPLLKNLAAEHGARLYYVVLSVTERELEQRLTQRGSAELIERSLFLKGKLESLLENLGHIYDISGKTVEAEILDLEMDRYEVCL